MAIKGRLCPTLKRFPGENFLSPIVSSGSGTIYQILVLCISLCFCGCFSLVSDQLDENNVLCLLLHSLFLHIVITIYTLLLFYAFAELLYVFIT